MFNTDQPITSSQQDILDRKSFAHELGRAILSYTDKGSLVIGLFGAWGSGKTSLINLSLEWIKTNTENRDDKPVVIRFNPWNFSEQNQLITQFFKVLSDTLQRPDNAKKLKAVGEKLEAYSEIFAPLKFIPVVGQYAELQKTVVKIIGKVVKSKGQSKEQNLDGIRDELNKLLLDLESKIIVVIDDIDRLTPIEIRQIFQLVKKLGDFPNTVYLLSFDKELVLKAFEEIHKGFEQQYLEKIVQVPFEIPPISSEDLHRLLFQHLDRILKGIPEEKFDKTYWGNIFHGGLKYFFNNIRDVNRYINTLSFGFPMVKDVVNPIDFIAITAIQVFLPEVYHGIKTHKEMFTHSGVSYFTDRSANKELSRKQYDEIIARADKLPTEKLTELLRLLFPKLESVYGNGNYNSNWNSTWRKAARICSADNFDIFFRLSVPENEITSAQMEAILSRADDIAAFTQILLELNPQKKLRFLGLLDDYIEDEIHIPHNRIEPIICTLMDVGDLFPEGGVGLFTLQTPMNISRTFYFLLRRVDNPAERYTILKHAIKHANKSLRPIVDIAAHETEAHSRYNSDQPSELPEKCLVTPEQLKELETLAVDKITEWAKDSRLSTHKYLAKILSSWRYWVDTDTVNNYIQSLIQTDEGLLRFVVALLSSFESYGMGDHVSRTNWKLSPQIVQAYVDIAEIEPRLKQLLESEVFAALEDYQQQAIEDFLRGLK